MGQETGHEAEKGRARWSGFGGEDGIGHPRGGANGEEREKGGKGRECFPAVLPKEEREENEEKRRGEEKLPREGTSTENEGRDCGQEGRDQDAIIGERVLGAKRMDGQEFENVDSVKAEHEGGTGNIPRDGAEKDEGGKGGGSGECQKKMENPKRRNGRRNMTKAGEAEERFAYAEEREGVERMVGFQAHGEVVGSVFEEIEKEGGGETGESPKPPDGGILGRGIQGTAGEEGQCGSNGGGGEGEVENGGSEPEGNAAEKAGEEEGKPIATRGRGEPERGEEERKDKGGGSGEMIAVVVRTERVEVPEQQHGVGENGQCGNGGLDSAAEEKPEGGKRNQPKERKEDATGQFKGVWGLDAERFQSGSDGAKRPNGELRPMDGTAIRGIVHGGVPDAEMGGCSEVAGIGKPGIRVRVDKEPGLAPRGRSREIGGVGCATSSKEIHGIVKGDGHADEP